MSKKAQQAEIGQAIDRLLPMPKVMDLTSFSKATIYRKVADGSFPAPRKIGKSRVAWSQAAVAEWMAAQAATTR